MKRPSMVKQVNDRLLPMAAYGCKKWMSKAVNNGKPFKDCIYSYGTMHDYQNKCIRFARWAKQAHQCKTLDEARRYVAEYLELHKTKDSAWTVRSYAYALGKLYGCSGKDFGVVLPPRRRQDVKRSRRHAERGHYSEKKNAGLLAIGKDSGLRRSELKKLTPDSVYTDAQGKHYALIRGKGGHVRFSPCLGTALYDAAAKAAAEGKEYIWQAVSDKIPSRIPEHAYRAQYAQALYERLARDPAKLPKRDRYVCRCERRGTVYDRKALRAISAALGHARLSIVTAYIK